MADTERYHPHTLRDVRIGLSQSWREMVYNTSGLMVNLFHMSVVGQENLEMIAHVPAVLAFARHESHLDSYAVRMAVPKPLRHKILVPAPRDVWYPDRALWPKRKKEALKRIAMSFLASVIFRRIPITREGKGGKSESVRDFKNLLGALDQGRWLIVSPEGTRDYAHVPLAKVPLKEGVAQMVVKRPNARLVPVYIRGFGKVMPKGRLLSIESLGQEVRVEFGEPLTLDPSLRNTRGNESRVVLTDMLRAAFLQLEQNSSRVR